MNDEEHQVLVSTLSPKKQLAFALLVFERMLPALVAFSKDTGFDDSCYLQAKDVAWATLQNGPADRSLTEACLREAPDTEDENYSHELISYALNATLAMGEIMEFTLDGSADHITRVSTLAGDSLDAYLSCLEDSFVSSPEEDRRIASHPLMLQEQRQEEEDVQFLSSLPDKFDDQTVVTLRKRAADQLPLLPIPD